MRIINEYDDKVYKLASENIKYNSEGKAVMTVADFMSCHGAALMSCR